MLNYKKPAFWIVGVAIIIVVFMSVRLMTSLTPSRIAEEDTLKTDKVQSPNPIIPLTVEDQLADATQSEAPPETQPEVIHPQITTDLEQSISNTILSSSARSGLSRVATVEGHITLQTVEKDSMIYTHILERYAVFDFKNGILMVISGHANPSLLSFQKDSTGNYILEEHIRALKDEIDAQVPELFPDSAVKRFTPTHHEKFKLELDSQIIAYGKAEFIF